MRTYTNPAPSVAPGGLKISHSLPTKAELSWCPLPVEKQNGVITGYKVQVVEPDSSREMSVQEADTTSVEISDLRPITSYTFIVSAMTKAGTGPAATIPFKTSEGGETFLRNYHPIMMFVYCTSSKYMKYMSAHTYVHVYLYSEFETINLLNFVPTKSMNSKICMHK